MADTTTTSWWVPEPNCGRGTWAILSDCILTIAFAVWTIQHPNVNMTAPIYRVLATLGFLLFPEGAAANAAWELSQALSLRRRMKDKWENWTLKQSFAIGMGAVCVTYPNVTHIEQDPDKTDNWIKWTLKKARVMAKTPRNKGHWDVPGEKISLRGEKSRLETVLPYTEHVRTQMPSNEALDRRSQTDGTAKLLALVQAIGFILRNIISRLAGDMSITLFEAFTFAHLVCALITYLSWLKKPQNLEDPIEIHLKLDEQTEMENKRQNSKPAKSHAPFWWVLLLGFAISSAIVGISLGLTWSAPFPSDVERWFWRSTHFITPVMVAIMILLFFLDRFVLFIVLLVLYGLVRLVIIGQCIAALRDISADIYQKPEWMWTNYWPAFGV